ncbi:PucR-like helix-turn-helix protein [Rhodococcus sp. OK611]|uniref:PucR family transcriptional regulator n=1 Tax=unclassified Rhodococcus (in: high G+C Gram-positive bacteria) TaxID=192944 RepID=UPI000BD8315F|nr:MULTISPECIES: helix-turn-helix domain-containing protein [unclassified Rhodococcus (in: high G+C Gram-positive bacteria)]PTR43573.1 PucR-like helix-turn-helix protein [Rhodococcus sp. OK611]SNX90918.1 PucR C-terminal helix-turn-helix domain-containing protein [Rhodococcus sp. OK270]
MTIANGGFRDDEPLRIAGRSVANWLDAAATDLTAAVIERLVDDLPIYKELPQEVVQGEIADIVHHNMELFATLVRERRPGRKAEFVEQRNSSARRAEEGVPLDAVLHAYHVGIGMAAEELFADAEPGDIGDVQTIMVMVLDFLRQLTLEVSSSYLEERQIMDSQENSGRRSLMAALVAGEPLDAIAQRTGLRLAPHYLAMSLSIGEHVDERGDGVSGTVAGRRKLRRLQAELDRITGEPALTVIDSSGGTALIPCPGNPPEWDALKRMVDRAQAVVGTEIRAAALVAAPAEVPAAVEQTAEIIALISRSGRPPGLYRLRDVLLEYQLSRPSPAHPELAGLLEPLVARPELMQTLEAYVASGLNRRATASALQVHANTVDYRMRRVAELTGLNPADPADLPHVGAALAARRALA